MCLVKLWSVLSCSMQSWPLTYLVPISLMLPHHYFSTSLMKQSLTYASEQTRTNTVITHSKTRSIVSWCTLHPENNNNNNMNWPNPIAELCLPWEKNLIVFKYVSTVQACGNFGQLTLILPLARVKAAGFACKLQSLLLPMSLPCPLSPTAEVKALWPTVVHRK